MKKIDKKANSNSFRKWMLFLVIIGIFFFIQGGVIESILNYDHIKNSLKTAVYRLCETEEGVTITDKSECENYARSQGIDLESANESTNPLYFGNKEGFSIRSFFYNKQSFWYNNGFWSGWSWLIIASIGLIALLLKFRRDKETLINSGLTVLKSEGILLTLFGIALFLFSSIFLNTIFIKPMLEIGAFGLKDFQFFILFSTAFLLPLGYQITAGILLGILVFVVRKYRGVQS